MEEMITINQDRSHLIPLADGRDPVEIQEHRLKENNTKPLLLVPYSSTAAFRPTGVETPAGSCNTTAAPPLFFFLSLSQSGTRLQ